MPCRIGRGYGWELANAAPGLSRWAPPLAMRQDGGQPAGRVATAPAGPALPPGGCRSLGSDAPCERHASQNFARPIEHFGFFGVIDA
jgi:hypothetical protein